VAGADRAVGVTLGTRDFPPVTRVFPACYGCGGPESLRGYATTVVERRDIASWLQGPSAATGRAAGGDYPGQRLGLPGEGPGRVAGFGARLAAFALDAVLCAVIAWGIPRNPAWTTPIFGVEVLVLTALAGASFGQRVRGLRVVRLDGRPLGVLRAALRTALLLLLVPALIWNRDSRGLHDRAAGSMVVHTR
jgi:RDD family protein